MQFSYTVSHIEHTHKILILIREWKKNTPKILLSGNIGSGDMDYFQILIFFFMYFWTFLKWAIYFKSISFKIAYRIKSKYFIISCCSRLSSLSFFLLYIVFLSGTGTGLFTKFYKNFDMNAFNFFHFTTWPHHILFVFRPVAWHICLLILEGYPCLATLAWQIDTE